MQGFQLNVALESAVSSTDWTDVAATGTKYSKWIDVSKYSELSVTQKAVYTNASGATIDTVIQMYSHGLATQTDHAPGMTQITSNATGRTAFSAFDTRVRLKITFGGTFGGTETIVYTAGIVGKG